MKKNRCPNFAADCCFVICSHSDVHVGDKTIKENDRAVLLEEGESKPPSTKAPNMSARAKLIR
jgi:hypothetical protein